MGAHPHLALVTGPEGTLDRTGRGLHRVVRGGAVNMAGAVVCAGLNLGVTVTITRAFSQESAGLFFFATSAFLIVAAVASLGAADGLVYFIARLRALGAAGLVPRVLRTAFGPAVALSLLAGGLMVVFADGLAALLREEGAAAYIRLLGVFLPFAVYADAALAATRAFHEMRTTVLVDQVGRPLAQLLLIGGIAATGSAGLLALAWAGPYLPAAVLAWFWLGRITRRAADQAAGDPGTGRTGGDRDAGGGAPRVDARAFWSFALPRSVANIAQKGIQRSGVVLVALLDGVAGAAVFTAATRLLVAGQFGAQAILHAAQPRIAEQLALADHGGVRTLYQASTAWHICLSWPLFLPGAIYAPMVMSLFGPQYAWGAQALAIACLAQVLASALGMGDLVLSMTGRTALNLVNNLFALAASVCLGVLLIPALGASGAAVALAAAVCVRRLLPLLQLWPELSLHPFSRHTAIAAGSSLLWFGALPLGLLPLLGTGAMSLCVAVCVGGAGHLATLWRFRTGLGLRVSA